MYITTFYSFKGGVGRSQAMVNVGFELAKTGRSVLLVDFDLEAPGLETFEFPHHPAPCKGIVDFITEYIQTNASPDVNEFLAKITDVEDTNGSLWLMPSGHSDEGYSGRLALIDWERLYRERGGYELIEDLRLQWQRAHSFDYVLIDSRTGYTDVAGICTRQLADAVVILFHPTDQNLTGLPKIVRDIRAESSRRRKEIDLHFVMSNVPSIDDEEQIVAQRLAQFRESLHFLRLSATIHHYDSIALLNQTIFTKDRPNTRLAKEYRRLAEQIAAQNVGDRAGALTYLDHLLGNRASAPLHTSRLDVAEHVTEILARHPDDSEILVKIATLQMRLSQYESAIALLDRVIESGADLTDAHIRRAECKYFTHKLSEAISDVKQALTSTTATDADIMRAIRILRDADDTTTLRSVGASHAVLSLPTDSQIWLADRLNKDISTIDAAIAIYERVSGHVSPESQWHLDYQRSLAYIAIGRFADAVSLLRELDGPYIGVRFNLAMADWGLQGKPIAEPFQRVLEAERDEEGDANYFQCLAVTEAVLGHVDLALGYLSQARRAVAEEPQAVFSCWRYYEVAPDVFVGDLDAIKSFAISGGPFPVFLSASHVVEAGEA